MDTREMLEKERIGKLLFRLALPTVSAQIINMLYNLVDRIYIGHIPGEGALALTGLGICFPLIMIISAFAMLMASGGAPRASIFMGKGELEKAEKCLGNSFSALLATAVVLTVLLLMFNKDILYLFGASENTIVFALPYMNIYALGTIFVQMTLGMNAFISAQGFAKTSMLSVLIGAVTNIILDPVFIYIFDLGVRGAAIATIISQGLSTLWVLSFLFGKKTLLRIRKENLRLEKDIILPSIALGTANFVMTSSDSIINILYNASLLKYGGDIAVGAMTILQSIMMFTISPLQGIGQGAQPIISYNYGAGNRQRVKKAFIALLISSLLYSNLLWASVMLFPSTVASFFSSDQALIAYTSPLIRIYSLALGAFGIQMAAQMTFTSLGAARSSITVAVMRKFVLLLPLIYLMPILMPENPALSIYIAEPIADFISITFATTLFTIVFSKTLKRMGKN